LMTSPSISAAQASALAHTPITERLSPLLFTFFLGLREEERDLEGTTVALGAP
jgi:hypothetical protein